MTNKPSHGFILWAIPRFHRPAQTTPNQSLHAPCVQTLFTAARPIEVAAAPAPEKTTAGPIETGECLYVYH
jgi:hypothetical protein